MIKSRFLLVILLGVLLLRIPNWFEPYWYGDEGITMTVGHEWFEGKLLYKQVSDNKPPLLYLFAGLSRNQPGFKILLTVWSLLTIACFWRLSRLLNSSHPHPQLTTTLSTSIFAILTTVPYWEGNNANGEIFMIGPVVAAMFLFVKYNLISKTHLVNHSTILTSFAKISSVVPIVIGILLSLAFLFKVPALMDMLTLLIFGFFLIHINSFKHWKILIAWGLKVLLGFATPLTLSCLYFWSRGSLSEYLSAAYGQNIGYASTWIPVSRWGSTAAWGGTVVHRALILIITTFILWLFRKRLSLPLTFVSLWFLFSLFGAMLSGRPYPHYLLQIVAPLSFLLVWLVVTSQLSTRLVSGCAFLLFLLAWARYGYWNYPVINYYTNFIQYASGQQSLQDYNLRFDKHVPRTYAIAEWLTAHSLPRQTVFIWSNEPQIYLLANKSVLGKYVTGYHIIDFHAESSTLRLIQEQRPQYIILIDGSPPPFAELDALVSSQYSLVTAIDEARIYRLANQI